MSFIGNILRKAKCFAGRAIVSTSSAISKYAYDVLAAALAISGVLLILYIEIKFGDKIRLHKLKQDLLDAERINKMLVDGAYSKYKRGGPAIEINFGVL